MNPLAACNKLPVVYALLAALCYGISMPVAKILLADMPPVFMAALLYLGAGAGMGIIALFLRGAAGAEEARLARADLPYIAAMVALDIAAPILLLLGLATTTAATAALLNNFEIVATSAIALVFFKEAFGMRMWLAVSLITFSSVILSVEDFGGLRLSTGAVFVLLACVFWGVENNCTGRLSSKNPLHIVIVKGLGSGAGAFLIALLTGGVADIPSVAAVAAALLLGFVAYGMSIYLYIRAQRGLGAARTSALYAFAPFIGVGLSFVIFRDAPERTFYLALAVMLIGAYLAALERHEHVHAHARMEHEHRHDHADGHHDHAHRVPAAEEHSHVHIHEPRMHGHVHAPDAHHAHSH